MTQRLYRIARLAALAALGFAVAGCGNHSVECTDDSATTTTISIVKDALQSATAKTMQNEDGSSSAPLAKIRAAIAQLVISIDDIRTTKTDPNSTKRFCTGTLKIRFPADALDDAEKARAAAGLNTVSDLADSDEVTRSADAFTSDIDYDVQPTDDGSSVYAETDRGNALFGFASEVLASGLLKQSIEDAKRAEQQEADQQNAAQQAALNAQHQADLAAAKTDDQLATQTIGATWKAIPDGVRHQLLPAQRAWIAKKDADCQVEAASSSTDPQEQQVARLNCDTRTTRERIDWLNQYRWAGNDVSAPASVMPSATTDGDDDL